MDLKSLRTFHAVAELGSLSKASDRLRTAQPALGRQIKLLEHELRTPLFVRHGRGMVLTDAGHLLRERTSLVVRQVEQARDDVLSIGAAPCGKVVLGMVPTIGSALALKIAARVTRDHPGIVLRLVEAYGRHLVEEMQRGDVDLAVIYEADEPLHLEAEALRADDLYAVGGPGSGLAGRAEITLEAAAAHPLILPSLPHALRLLVDRAFAVRDLPSTVRLEADSLGAMLAIVRGGVGITFLPFYAVAAEVAAGTVEVARIVPGMARRLVLASPPRPQTSRAAAAVAQILREEVRALADG